MAERFIRVLTHRSLEVDVSAADYWEMLLDWPAVTKWMPTKDAPVPLVKSVLRDGHKLGTLPCTRDCHFDNSKLPEGLDPSVLPSVLSETLLYVDNAAKFLYYNMEGTGPFGMRNYLATTTVDEISSNRARVTCSGRFDIADAGSVEIVKGFIEVTYETGIIRGIEAAIKREQAVA